MELLRLQEAWRRLLLLLLLLLLLVHDRQGCNCHCYSWWGFRCRCRCRGRCWPTCMQESARREWCGVGQRAGVTMMVTWVIWGWGHLHQHPGPGSWTHTPWTLDTHTLDPGSWTHTPWTLDPGPGSWTHTPWTLDPGPPPPPRAHLPGHRRAGAAGPPGPGADPAGAQCVGGFRF